MIREMTRKLFYIQIGTKLKEPGTLKAIKDIFVNLEAVRKEERKDKE